MKEFKKSNGGYGNNAYNKRDGDRPSFGGRPSFNKFGGGSDRGAPMMHKATCAECGNNCEVPFRPNGEKPVFCNDCFGDKRDQDFAPRPKFDRPVPRPMSHDAKPDVRVGEIFNQLSAMNAKFDTLIEMMKPASAKHVAPAEKAVAVPASKKVEPKADAKVAKPAAKKVAVKKAPVAKKEAAPKKKVVAKKKK